MRKIAYFVSGRWGDGLTQIGNTGTYRHWNYGECGHRHRTRNDAERCAEKRRENDGFIVAIAMDEHDYPIYED